MMSYIFSIFPVQVLDKLDLEVLDLGIFQNQLYYTAIWIGVSNTQEFLYMR